MNDPEETRVPAEREAQFAELLRSIWLSTARATRSMEHLPTLAGQHVDVLQLLTAAGGLTPAQLALAMHLSRPTISELTRKMVDENLISRTPSERDGRSVVLVPTDSALRVLAAFRHGLVEVISAGLEQLPDRERLRLLAAVPALTRLEEHVARIASDLEPQQSST
jgi:DNA-binding MarR family transcriptional regulator